MSEHLDSTSADAKSNARRNEQASPFMVIDAADDASYRRSHGGPVMAYPWPGFEVKPDPDAAPAKNTFSVLLARRPRPFQRILIAVDQSQQAAWALEVATRLAVATGAELAIVHVVDGMPFGDGPTAGAGLSAEQQGAQIMRDLALHVPREVRVARWLRHGVPGREIVNAASEWGADLIVLGTHGRGTVSRYFLLLGSVADHVLRYADCPVMTVSQPPATARRSNAADAAPPWREQLTTAEALAGTPMCA